MMNGANGEKIFADVILPLAVPNLFTYEIPDEWKDAAAPGKRVIVPFGKQKFLSGLIRRIHIEPSHQGELKPIVNVLDDFPVIHPRQFELWDWIADYYMSHLGEVMNCALPAAMKIQSETKILLNPDFDREKIEVTAIENAIIDELEERHELSVADIEKIVRKKNTHQLLRIMMERGVIILSEELQERYRPKKEARLSLAANYRQEREMQDLFLQFEQDPRKEQQLGTLMSFLKLLYEKEEREYIRKKDLLEMKDVSPSSVATLIKNSVLMETDVIIDRVKISADAILPAFPLSPAQQQALNEIHDGFQSQDVILFHGVTSSGKTEIYIHLIEEALKYNKQVLYLLPEIALTTQIITRLRRHFGDQVDVYHSRYSNNERVEVWNRVLSFDATKPAGANKSQVILGARSALFLPFSDLGLIIVDEEHDSSYKQVDPAPRYNARDTAILLARIHGAKTLLGSGTPSLESNFNAEQNRYGIVHLTERYGGVRMPEIIIADTKEAARKKLMKSHFSPALLQTLKEALDQKEQVILFQNRRGFAPFLECRQCAWIPHCKNCSVTLTYHKGIHQLKCHYCGYIQAVPAACLNCGDKHVEVKGFGTEKIEEEIAIFFPDARIARMDLDATRTRLSFQKIIHDFEERRIDILVGTQMVTKGLDFDNVSTVGIINADQLMHYPDFRSFERSFQLMEQVSGRSGRKQKQGRVVIQTQNPAHWVIRNVVNHDYKSFYNTDLQEREKFGYPPFSRLIEITMKHRDNDMVQEAAMLFTERLRNKLGNRILGPHVPVIPRIRNFFHREVIIKLERKGNQSEFRNIIREEIREFFSLREYHSVQLHIDVDPM